MIEFNKRIFGIRWNPIVRSVDTTIIISLLFLRPPIKKNNRSFRRTDDSSNTNLISLYLMMHPPQTNQKETMNHSRQEVSPSKRLKRHSAPLCFHSPSIGTLRFKHAGQWPPGEFITHDGSVVSKVDATNRGGGFESQRDRFLWTHKGRLLAIKADMSSLWWNITGSMISTRHVAKPGRHK